ncbi:MAG: hypothetical protein H7Z75_22835 [Ferruginibacter sp.]|nr:hypothetical protein [Cytophagales bacterium]
MNTENVLVSLLRTGGSQSVGEFRESTVHRPFSPVGSLPLQAAVVPLPDDDDDLDEEELEDDFDEEEDDLEDDLDEEDADDLGYMDDVDERELEEPFYEEGFEDDLEEEEEFGDEL